MSSEATPAPATTAEPAPAVATTADPAIEELNQKIAAAEKANAEKKTQLEKATADADAANQDANEVKSKLQTLTQKHADLTSERDGLKKQETDLLPAYERCLQNKETKERAVTSRKTIEQLEKQIADDHTELQRLTQELERVSQAYEETITRKNRFLDSLRNQCSQLFKCVHSKIETTINDPAILRADDLAHVADVCSDLVVQRESDLRNAVRHQREVDAAVALKEEMLKTIESSTGSQLDEKRKQKDEFIKEMVFQMQEERNVLQADIDEVRRVNEEQSTNLTRGHVMRSVDPVSFKRQDSSEAAIARRRSLSHGRVTKFVEPSQSSAEELTLNAQNDAITRDIQTATQKLSLETHNKTEFVKTLKAMSDKVKRDSDRFASALQELEAKVVAQVAATKLLERENGRLVDQVDHLTTTLKGTKSHLERIRGRAAPLPIEE